MERAETKKHYFTVEGAMQNKNAYHMPLEDLYHEECYIAEAIQKKEIVASQDKQEMKDESKLIFPFLQTNPTSGSLAYKTMKLFCVPRDTFYVSSEAYGKNLAKSCLIEREFFYIMRKLGPAAGNVKFCQDVQVQIRMGNQVLDGYSPSKKIGYLFQGCWEHGHRGCQITKRGNCQMICGRFFFTFFKGIF